MKKYFALLLAGVMVLCTASRRRNGTFSRGMRRLFFRSRSSR